MKKFDLFVIGTGVSGTAIAQECIAQGLKVGITDQRPYGGTCAMRGCVPKKVLFGASEIVEAATRPKGKGIDNVPTIVWSDLVAFKQTFVEPVTYAYKIIFDKTNHKILGAHLVGPHVEETICLFTMAIQAGIKISEIEKILFPYPVSGADIKSMLT